MVNGKRAHKTDADEQSGPEVPSAPVAERQQSQKRGKQKRRDAMSALAQGADDVAAIELRGGKKIERGREQAHPSCPARGMQKDGRGAGAMMKNRPEAMKD